MHDRVKNLRKQYLKLSQEAFGKRLGVSRSVINNIERNCLARPEQKLSLIKLMCKEFNVNEDWILNGIEPIFTQDAGIDLDEFGHKHGASDLEVSILKAYFQIDKNIRAELLEQLLKNLNKGQSEEIATQVPDISSIPDTPEELEKLYPPIELNKNKVI